MKTILVLIAVSLLSACAPLSLKDTARRNCNPDTEIVHLDTAATGISAFKGSAARKAERAECLRAQGF